MSSPVSQRLSKQNNSNSDSVLNLTKPQLYSIYQDQNIDDDSNDMYTNLKDDIKSVPNNSPSSIGIKRQSLTFWKIIKALISLSILGNLYIILVEKLHESNPILPNLTTYKIIHLLNITNSNNSNYNNNFFSIFKRLNSSNYYNFDLRSILSNSIEGIILGSIQPIFDKLIFQNLKINTKPLFNNNGGSILRLTISFIGISYLMKKTEWNSSLQASEIWSFLNPLIWLLLDTTLTGFISASFVSICSMIGYLLTLQGTTPIIENINNILKFDDTLIKDEASNLLWVGSFIFIGLIIFGKIGRYLYN